MGDGTYTVQVSAYGEPDEPGGHRQLLSRDEATAGGKATRKAGVRVQAVGHGARANEEDGRSSGELADGGREPGSPAPSCEETDAPPEPPADEPAGDDGTTSDASGEGAEDGAAGAGDVSAREPAPALGEVPEATAAELASGGELPDAVDCPEG